MQDLCGNLDGRMFELISAFSSSMPSDIGNWLNTVIFFFFSAINSKLKTACQLDYNSISPPRSINYSVSSVLI